MRKLFLSSIVAILLMVGVNFAATPSFDFSPASGSTLKLHCNYNVNIQLNAGGQKYNAFAAAVKFDAAQVSGVHKTIYSPFVDNINGFVTGGNLYRAYGSLPGGQWYATDVPAATFGFKTLVNITGTTIQFTDLNGDPISFGPATTADGSTINGYDVSSADILTAVYDATYSFIPFPCVMDVDVPLFVNMLPTNNAYHVLSGQRFSALVYDRKGIVNIVGPAPLATNSTRHYRYNGLNAGDLNNYQAAPVTVDNQEGVNSGTIKVIVSCPNCVSFGGPYLLSGNALNLSMWTGDGIRNQITWQNKDRGYVLGFNPPAPYEIEKLVNITLQATDNPNYGGQVNTGLQTLSFNAPVLPVITPIYPTANATYVDWKNTQTLRFYLSDDRAGIDTGTIQITIPQIMSGAQVLMTGYTYSGSDLIITLSGGAPGAGNAGSYMVQFTGKRNFASNTGIRITGTVLDFAGNSGGLDMRFYTRPSCEDRGCAAIFQVFTLTGNYAGGPFNFSGSLIIITGTDLNSPYPYLTGVGGDILMCGFPYEGAILTGNIPIADTQSGSVHGSLYTGTKLYITGLNFTVQNGVIVITP